MAATNSADFCGPYSPAALPGGPAGWPHMQENYGDVSVGAPSWSQHPYGGDKSLTDQGFGTASVGQTVVNPSSLGDLHSP